MKHLSIVLLYFIAFSFSGLCQEIREIKIGSQVWMSANLNVDKFRNGDPIMQVKTVAEWTQAGENKQPAWCYYNNSNANGTKYGKLYNWYAVNDPRGLAPLGWHIPSNTEWTKLIDNLGDSAGNKMKSKKGWKENGNGSNENGFSGFPGGFRNYLGEFNTVGGTGYWWSSTENDIGDAWAYFLAFDLANLPNYINYKAAGLSVRCIRD